MENKESKPEKPDFDQYIFANVGISKEAFDNCPADKGEIKYMLNQMWNDCVLPLIKEREELKADVEHYKQMFSNANDVYIDDVTDYKGQIEELKYRVSKREDAITVVKNLRLHWKNESHKKDIRIEELKKEIEELKGELIKCEKSFGLIDTIFTSLKSAGRSDLNDLVNEIDIDLPLIQAKIKDTLNSKT